ncbi:MAG: UvrD-helicase domain-containing protein, partial [Planctomycetes bacterium]|nr:UvrD-helicase domain-containing protein [Planctomycetota bacterium]
LFNEFAEVLDKYRRRYRFVLVDEFQDTNKLQYDIVKLLCAAHKNICVTGDPDQAIYSWRGADVGNIIAFEKDFKNAEVVLLPKNYRSTKKILLVADSLIEHNINRKPKRMITDNVEGENIIVRKLWDEEEEAAYVCKELLDLQAKSKRLGDCAVFYRTNAQSRTLEKKLIEYSIPYTIVKGLEFFQRKEIKDIIAYLRIIHNPRDMVSLMRIVNTPTRKIGARTIACISQYAFEKDIRFDKVFWNLPEDLSISKGGRKAIKAFIMLIEDFKTLKDAPVGNLINFILLSTDYDEYLKRTDSLRAEDKIENIQELITDADKFEEGNKGAGLGEYLEQIALMSDSDKFDQIEDKINLLTLHTAKGLEFSTVFMVGIEEGMFPHSRVIEGDGDIEEERRLCYVGITRTEKLLYMTFCESRTFIGRTNYNEPSRFLDEIDKDCVSYFNQHNEQVPFNLNTMSEFSSKQWKYEKTEFSDDVNVVDADQIEQNNNESQIVPDSLEMQYNPETNKYEFSSDSDGVSDGVSEKIPNEMMFEPEDFSEFNKGDRIFHDKFGKGYIEGIKGKGNNIKAQIRFDDVGMKTIVLSFAKLKRIM